MKISNQTVLVDAWLLLDIVLYFSPLLWYKNRKCAWLYASRVFLQHPCHPDTGNLHKFEAIKWSPIQKIRHKKEIFNRTFQIGINAISILQYYDRLKTSERLMTKSGQLQSSRFTRLPILDTRQLIIYSTLRLFLSSYPSGHYKFGLYRPSIVYTVRLGASHAQPWARAKQNYGFCEHFHLVSIVSVASLPYSNLMCEILHLFKT